MKSADEDREISPQQLRNLMLSISDSILIKRNEYGYKCMLVAVKQVLDYMEALNDTIVDVGGSLRKESRLFDFPCFREAWLNACLHNRWSRQTPPAVYMFEDRIEVISVGGLPEGLTLEEFYYSNNSIK